jgi:Sec-independent protein translocase protein TatA
MEKGAAEISLRVIMKKTMKKKKMEKRDLVFKSDAERRKYIEKVFKGTRVPEILKDIDKIMEPFKKQNEENKKNENKKTAKKPKVDSMIEHLKQEIEKDMSCIELTEERLAAYRTRVAQNRKILKKLKG